MTRLAGQSVNQPGNKVLTACSRLMTDLCQQQQSTGTPCLPSENKGRSKNGLRCTGQAIDRQSTMMGIKYHCRVQTLRLRPTNVTRHELWASKQIHEQCSDTWARTQKNLVGFFWVHPPKKPTPKNPHFYINLILVCTLYATNNAIFYCFKAFTQFQCILYMPLIMQYFIVLKL